jgi:hypothetical protein
MEKKSFFPEDLGEKIKINNILKNENTHLTVEFKESNSLTISSEDKDISTKEENFNEYVIDQKSKENNFNLKNINFKEEKINKRLRHYGNNVPLIFDKNGEPLIVIGPQCNKIFFI